MSTENDTNKPEIGKPPVAGRELDAEIALAIFGYEYDKPAIECYSTDIAAAWTVVDKFRNKGVRVELDGNEANYRWYCYIGFHAASRFCDDPPDPEFFEHEASADTAPLAICLAALAAVEHSNKE